VANLLGPITLDVKQESFKLDGTFTISRGSRTEANVLTVTLGRGACRGWGECLPYARYDESMQSVTEQIRSIEADLANGLDRDTLQGLLPAGAARNAVDCALWDLEAKESGKTVWQLAGLSEPQAITTAFTLSLESPSQMRASAAKHGHRPLLKIKLGGAGDMDRLRAVREGAPNARLIVDANEGWSAGDYDALAPLMVDLGVTLVEQPLPAGNDAALANRERPLPVCADEACHDRSSLDGLQGKYDVINIKLDKTGGLTEALALRDAGLAQGFDIMVGCMVSTSLAMAPALLVAQGVSVVDLDGPLLLAEDRATPMPVTGSQMQPASATLWG